MEAQFSTPLTKRIPNPQLPSRFFVFNFSAALFFKKPPKKKTTSTEAAKRNFPETSGNRIPGILHIWDPQLPSRRA